MCNPLCGLRRHPRAAIRSQARSGPRTSNVHPRSANFTGLLSKARSRKNPTFSKHMTTCVFAPQNSSDSTSSQFIKTARGKFPASQSLHNPELSFLYFRSDVDCRGELVSSREAAAPPSRLRAGDEERPHQVAESQPTPVNPG